MKIPAHFENLPAYTPGKLISEVAKEYKINSPVKLASNENALGVSPKAVLAMKMALEEVYRYPDAAGRELQSKLATFFSVKSEEIVLGNGSGDILSLLGQVLLQPGDEVIVSQSAFSLYRIVAQSAGCTIVEVPLKNYEIDLSAIQKAITSKTRMIFLTSPNNPTGLVLAQKALKSFLDKISSDILVVLDEAYIEFAVDPDTAEGIWFFKKGYSVAVIRTFAKIFGLAGIRIGFGIMPEKVAAILQRVRMPFNVNGLAQTGALAALEDTDFIQQTKQMIEVGKQQLTDGLKNLKVKTLPTQSNFIFIDLGEKNADVFVEALLKQGVIVRSAKSFGFPNAIRVTIGLSEENAAFLTAFKIAWLSA